MWKIDLKLQTKLVIGSQNFNRPIKSYWCDRIAFESTWKIKWESDWFKEKNISFGNKTKSWLMAALWRDMWGQEREITIWDIYMHTHIHYDFFLFYHTKHEKINLKKKMACQDL